MTDADRAILRLRAIAGDVDPKWIPPHTTKSTTPPENPWPGDRWIRIEFDPPSSARYRFDGEGWAFDD